MIIGVNCGHTKSGTAGSGAVGILDESNETRAVGHVLMEKLRSRGHTVVDCTNDIAPTTSKNLSEIVRLANAQRLDLFVSIHFNAGGGNGVECWTYAGRDLDEARKINHNIALLGFKNRGIKDGSHLYVVKNTNAKAILVEVCFVDNEKDADQYKLVGFEQIAEAIANGISGEQQIANIEQKSTPKTVYSLNDVHCQVILPQKFKIKLVDCNKMAVKDANYANAGFFAIGEKGATLPVGNLVISGDVITDAKHQADWLNTYNHLLTTVLVRNDNSVEMVQCGNMSTVFDKDVKYAISGIPIIKNGYKVSMDDIKKEGYFGSEVYDTWHGFLGVRDDKLIYVASKIGFDGMVYLLEVLGIKNAIKLDGGGSFILKNGTFEVSTGENRRINNIITWEA